MPEIFWGNIEMEFSVSFRKFGYKKKNQLGAKYEPNKYINKI